MARDYGRLPRTGGLKHFGGRTLARAHGRFDGFLGSEERIQPELARYKERGEETINGVARWWANAARALEGECDALDARLRGLAADETRLTDEVAGLKSKWEKSKATHDEHEWRNHEHELEVVRAQRRDLTEQLERARAERRNVYAMTRASAEQFKNYYEGLMKTYCAANRKADRDGIPPPPIDIPQSLSRPALDE